MFCVFVAELSRRNSEETLDPTAFSKKSVVVLKKELAQKTEALNAALKRENQLKVHICIFNEFSVFGYCIKLPNERCVCVCV